MILDLKSSVEKIEGKSEDNHNDAVLQILELRQGTSSVCMAGVCD